MSCVSRRAWQLSQDVGRDMAVHGDQSRLPAGRQTPPDLLNDRRPIRNVASVIEDRVAQQYDMAHEIASRLPVCVEIVPSVDARKRSIVL